MRWVCRILHRIIGGTRFVGYALQMGWAVTERLPMPKDRMAELYRMVLPDNTCPYEVRAKVLLEQNDFGIEEHILSTRDDVESFKAEHGVEMTPLIFIDGERIGGNADLERHRAKA